MNWKETVKEIPEEMKPVFLSQSDQGDEVECDLGCLVLNKKGEKFWHIGNEKFIKLNARKFWQSLALKDNVIPADTRDDELRGWLAFYLQRLETFDKRFLTLGKEVMYSGNGLYDLDFYVAGILNRAMSLSFGFITLMGSSNYISAAHLVRPFLDTYLRLTASWLVSNPHEFARKVLLGERIDLMRDKDNKQMTDCYLVQKETSRYPWMKKVYEETSGFVHFSSKHIHGATAFNKMEDGKVKTFIGRTDNEVSEENKLEAVIGMIEIANCIVEQVFGWVLTKRLMG
ncbi:hypothetical protein OQX63_04900 [Pedobacter sp. PF22-3]|uniref:hypothetical protein n=1 Tax=Pedobacter sp. PF22-3 TaxID=2994467 RepID=UPI002247F6B9|nr:hypothetical protein [Pedobacter sp. PF22-3]MCX2492797.1 hypothetical protein [Pedobacter sp. PF22-3]